MNFLKRYGAEAMRGDLFGGVTAAVVGLPVALAFGLASGLGPLPGLYGAVAVGFFASVFGGSKSQVSGPTGPMSVAMAVIVTLYADDLAKAFTIVVMAGLIQILLGALRIGRFVSYTPYSVISGFMSGIGVIIMLVHVLPFLGHQVVSGGPLAAVAEIPRALSDVNLGALLIASVTLAVAVIWPSRFRKVAPPTLVALVVGALMGVFWLTETPVIGEVPTGLPEFMLPNLSGGFLLDAVAPAVTIALLGSIDTLLTALVVDSMTNTRHNPNRALLGQGIGNIASGLIGGLPGAGATLDSIVNIRAGGRTQVSSVLRAGILLALVLGLAPLVEKIPHAVLAGILMKVGWDIVDWRFLGRIHKIQKEHLVIMGLTMGLTVFLDLITAVAIGLIAAGMASSRKFEFMEMDNVVSVPLLDATFLNAPDGATAQNESADRPSEALDEEHSARCGLVAMRGSFTVASSNKIIDALSVDIAEHELVVMDFSETVYMDDSAALTVQRMVDTALQGGSHVIVMGLQGRPAAVMQALGALDMVPKAHVVSNLEEAADLASRILPKT